ncbi:hypothetical protein GCM10009127_13460 [Alteraurantiacibacter aestuarii]|uniref:Phage tail sheath family protein n=1 Tax=Alteraurantiacibacter aestuarii TaxID=650004 RepID=A0A844ZKH7_9SPHN|nr:phage tail sheath C-terminal domain-containing protein [Alteraurantiacibacter aestuarii]MXO88064.1 hypothetical protein [Alteraurantiacibacter aestuarii]
MSVEVSYPGVYIEELPSGQKTVTPVATNIAAFVGRALFGSTDEPITINSYGDFQNLFGGLQFDYPMSYAVQDFFNNGGSQAVIARLFEPTLGDGAARMRFPPAPPAAPDGWLIDANATAGATSLTVAPPDAESEAAPVAGMTFALEGDPGTQYTVTGFTPANKTKKTLASVTIAPVLARDFRKCTKMVFQAGPSPSGWTGFAGGNNQITLAGGSGIPELGDLIQFANDTTGASYAIIASPQVTGTDPNNLTLKLTLSGKPTAADGAVIFSSPVALPMPLGWEIEQTALNSAKTIATLSIINGTNAPLPGDQFTVANDPNTYVVGTYTAATAKADATITVTILGGGTFSSTQFCLCCAPIFNRAPPENATIKKLAKSGDISITITPPELGTVDIGDTFQVEGDDTFYSVRHIDQNTIYFLPKAEADFTKTGITFFPTLQLKAANPGKWGNLLTAKTDKNGISAETAKQFQSEYQITADDLFNLTLTLYNAKGQAIASERYLNLSVSKEGEKQYYPNRVDKVLASESALARVDQISGMPPGDGQVAQGVGGNNGTYLTPTTYLGNQDRKTGIYLLEKTDLFNLLCIPPDRRFLPEVAESMQDLDVLVRGAAAEYCTNKRAFFIVDPPANWADKARQGLLSQLDPSQVGITGANAGGQEYARNCAVYFPRIWKEDLKMKGRQALFPPCGAIAGVMAATDVGRGVWKAPAGQAAGLAGVSKLDVKLTDAENGELNPKGINCLRSFPIVGPVVWGSRTLRGADAFEDAYKYIPVRRFTLFVEESLYRSTQWAVFEPNNEALWSSLRLEVGSFLAGLARQGALYDYTVQCDAKNNTADRIARGIVTVTVGIAPVDPAEFVILQIQQTAPASA